VYWSVQLPVKQWSLLFVSMPTENSGHKRATLVETLRHFPFSFFPFPSLSLSLSPCASWSFQTLISLSWPWISVGMWQFLVSIITSKSMSLLPLLLAPSLLPPPLVIVLLMTSSLLKTWWVFFSFFFIFTFICAAPSVYSFSLLRLGFVSWCKIG